jgi:hypothetical protein
MFDDLNPAARRAIYLIVETGLRLSEAINLSREAIRLNAAVPHASCIERNHRRAPCRGLRIAMPAGLEIYSGHCSTWRPRCVASGAVRALHLLGPHAAKPSTPILEAACLRIVTTMLDGDPRAVTSTPTSRKERTS